MVTEGIFFKDWEASHIPEILGEIYLRQIYRPFVEGKKDITIVDAGANIGLTAYYFKDYGKVYVIEPTKAHLDTLKTMIEFNKITNITICPFALSNKTEERALYHSTNSIANSLNLLQNKDDFEMVNALSFGDFMKKYTLTKIDILKLDVEGEESKIITSDEFKEYSPNIKVIIGEWHEWTQMNKEQFRHTIEDLGFTFKWIPMGQVDGYTAVRL